MLQEKILTNKEKRRIIWVRDELWEVIVSLETKQNLRNESEAIRLVLERVKDGGFVNEL